MKNKKKCNLCQKYFNATHLNQKYHRQCAATLRKKPKGRLTAEQVAIVEQLAGTMYIKDLAKKIGTSDSNLDRWARDNDFNINALKYRKNTINEVCEFYGQHGKIKTQEKFPNVRVRSIVERYYNGDPRQIPWTDQQLVDLARIANFASASDQAKFFNRPRAKEGAISSVWIKRYGMYPGNLHGWYKERAKNFVTKDCPFIEIPNFMKVGKYKRKLAIWVDIQKHLKKDAPDIVRDAVEALSQFQIWLYGGDPKLAILNIMEGLRC